MQEASKRRSILGAAVQRGNAKFFLKATAADAAAQQRDVAATSAHIQALLQKTPADRMQGTLRRLQREWHPDKNRGAEADARRVFDFVQAEWQRWQSRRLAVLNGTS